MLIRKMLRDVWKNKIPFLAIFIMIFTGNFIFSGITGEYNGLEQSFERYIGKTGMADAWIYGTEFSEDEAERLRELPAVRAVERRMYIPAMLDREEKQSVDICIPEQENNISAILVTEGEEYSASLEGAWMDARFAQENNYRLHERIGLAAGTIKIEAEIIGFCYQPEYIYHIQEGEMVPDHKKSGFVIINQQSLPDAGLIRWNQLLVRGSGIEEEALLAALGRNDCTVLLQKDHPSYSMVQDEISQHREIGLIFAGVFLFIALLVSITTVHRLLNSQRQQIGVLKAMGFRKRRLYFHYVSHSTFVCLMGAFLGWGAGYLVLPGLILPFMRDMYTIPELSAVSMPYSWVLPVLCSLSCLVISVAVCRKYLAGNAADILYSNGTVKAYHEIPLSFLWRRLSFYVQWNSRDIFRNKLRSAMTVFGVAGCVALLYAAMGLNTSVNHVTDWNLNELQTYEAKASGSFSDPVYKNTLLEAMNGEELMEATVEIVNGDQKVKGSFTGISGNKYIHLRKDEKTEITLEQGAALSKNTAIELGVEQGDEIEWRFTGSSEWYTSEVASIIRTPMQQGITMQKEYMEEEGIPFAATAVIGREPEQGVILSEYVSHMQNKEELGTGLDSILDASVMLYGIFLTAAILLGSVILYNLGTLFYMERYRDMATLKVLGLPDRRIRKLMIQQNIWLTVTGILAGLPLGKIMLGIMFGTIQDSIDIPVYTPVFVYLSSILGTFVLSWVINKVLSCKVYHIDMAAALKANE